MISRDVIRNVFNEGRQITEHLKSIVRKWRGFRLITRLLRHSQTRSRLFLKFQSLDLHIISLLDANRQSYKRLITVRKYSNFRRGIIRRFGAS